MFNLIHKLMETEKKQTITQDEKKVSGTRSESTPLDTKVGKVVLNAAVASTAGIAAVAVDRSLHTPSRQEVDSATNEQQETVQDERNDVVETAGEPETDVVAIVEPEPIASTDGIDVVVSVDDGVRIAQVDVREPVVEDDVLPEPILPEPDLIAQVTTDELPEVDPFTEIDAPEVAITSNDVVCDNIADSIQQDLFA